MSQPTSALFEPPSRLPVGRLAESCQELSPPRLDLVVDRETPSTDSGWNQTQAIVELAERQESWDF